MHTHTSMHVLVIYEDFLSIPVRTMVYGDPPLPWSCHREL